MATIAMKVFPAYRQAAGKPEVTCQPLGNREQSPWVADVHGIAGTGLRLASQRRFEPGAILVVRVRDAGHDDPTQLLARVVNVGGAGEGKWLMDCRLTSELDDANVKVLRRAMRDAG